MAVFLLPDFIYVYIVSLYSCIYCVPSEGLYLTVDVICSQYR